MPRPVPYETAKKRFFKSASVDEKRRIQAAELSLATPALARQFLQSLKLERNVTQHQWGSVFRWIVGSTRLSHDLCMELCGKFATMLDVALDPADDPESFRKRPIGPVCHHLRDVCFGRVRTFSQLAAEFAEYNGAKISEAWTLLNDQLRELERGPVITAGDNLPLGNFLMWSTFDKDRSSDPFKPRPGTVADFLAEAGMKCDLSDFDPDETFVVAVYRLPDDIRPHVPTIFEAYAGKPNYRFRPIEWPKMPGLTEPDPRYAHRSGRPEVVHGVLFARNLIERPARRRLHDPL